MSNAPFDRDGFVNKPGLIGARWWQQGLAAPPDPVTRRGALATILVVGAALGGVGMILALASGSDDDGPAPTPQPKPSLDIQREYGWNFGARSESLTFDGVNTAAFDRKALDQLVDDFGPASKRHLPYWSPTLFQAPTSLPKKTAEADAAEPFKPLRDVLRPMRTAAMDAAFARGRALARLLAELTDVAVVIDLPGPEAVAFAAGMAGWFDPVFTFENWPHPRGVVPAHRTLAAALYYQPLFRKRRSDASGKPPMFVLDRDRLASYVDETKQFDNRWVAKLPSAAGLRGLGIEHVLYITPSEHDAREMDDVNDDAVSWSASQLDVRMVGATALAPCADKELTFAGEQSAPPSYCYGGSAETDDQFFVDYPVREGAPKPKAEAAIGTAARSYRPKPRSTPYSTGAMTSTASKPRPQGFGTVPVMVAVGTAAVLGWRHHRNGSWNRAPSSGGGWGFG